MVDTVLDMPVKVIIFVYKFLLVDHHILDVFFFMNLNLPLAGKLGWAGFQHLFSCQGPSDTNCTHVPPAAWRLAQASRSERGTATHKDTNLAVG